MGKATNLGTQSQEPSENEAKKGVEDNLVKGLCDNEATNLGTQSQEPSENVANKGVEDNSFKGLCDTGVSRIKSYGSFKIDDPELTREGQPSVPETLLQLRQKVERLSKPIQTLRDLADILERPTQKPCATPNHK